jgi:hypothetical protein
MKRTWFTALSLWVTPVLLLSDYWDGLPQS